MKDRGKRKERGSKERKVGNEEEKIMKKKGRREEGESGGE